MLRQHSPMGKTRRDGAPLSLADGRLRDGGASMSETDPSLAHVAQKTNVPLTSKNERCEAYEPFALGTSDGALCSVSPTTVTGR
jgi:hypothetical protein